jgi:hypothetical protein
MSKITRALRGSRGPLTPPPAPARRTGPNGAKGAGGWREAGPSWVASQWLLRPPDSSCYESATMTAICLLHVCGRLGCCGDCCCWLCHGLLSSHHVRRLLHSRRRCSCSVHGQGGLRHLRCHGLWRPCCRRGTGCHLRRRCRWLRGCGGCRQHTGRDGHPRGDTHPQGLKAGKRKAAAVQLGERGRPGGAPHTCKEHVGEGVRRQGAAAGPHWRAQALRDHERCAVVVRILCDWQACRLQEGCSGALQAAKGWRASQAQLCCVRLREPGLLADRNVHHVIPTGHREGRASQQEAQGCGFGGLKAAGLPGQHCGGPLWLVHVQGCMALQDHGVEAISEMADGHCVGCAGQLTQLLGRPVCWQEALGLREKQNGHFGPSAWTAHCLCAEWRCAGAVEGSKTANIGCGIEVGGQASCRRGWRPHCEAARVPHSTSVLKAAMGRPEAKGGGQGGEHCSLDVSRLGIAPQQRERPSLWLASIMRWEGKPQGS